MLCRANFGRRLIQIPTNFVLHWVIRTHGFVGIIPFLFLCASSSHACMGKRERQRLRQGGHILGVQFLFLINIKTVPLARCGSHIMRCSLLLFSFLFFSFLRVAQLLCSKIFIVH